MGDRRHEERMPKKEVARKELNFEEFQRRQKIALAMLENAPADPMAALEEKYRNKMLAQQHQQARLVDEQRCQAIHGQDIYEEDAELDLVGYAGYLTNQKAGGAVVSGPLRPEGTYEGEVEGCVAVMTEQS